MSMVKASGFAELEAMFVKAAEVLEDEDAVRKVSHEALQPIKDEMYTRIQKRSRKTADDIRIGDEPSSPAIVRTAVGFGGRNEKTGRAFVANFLEYGTSRRRAYPFMRPAYDSTGGVNGLGHRAAQGIFALLSPVLKL
jgi:HK97 gp10 family phage protein